MRLIDADALLMNMNLAIAILEGTMKTLGLQDDEGCQMELKAYRDIRDGIKDEPTVEPEPHWISCSERLPEENGQYLITVRYKHVDGYEDVYAEHGDWCDGNWDMFCFGHCGEVESILAWMPLPEPYRG